ncbi:hypothetical protein D9757_008893 [Collybiopsis confluens]|uniref:Rab-GAP TBC domain-containing protein n=1 Tax=Collybiopsis confluens TaxID=2823264 RepID=A0A8H5M0Y7_9AGAR|nr:hypothetical protein D9757_008893 [Collybiopsis confluens]
MDALELSRWTRFAAKGGIGKCTAVQDCVAESGEDLMFLKDDEITVLMQIPEFDGIYLGYCEGVVGKFQAHTVRFHSKLKRPVMTKRNSAAMASRVKSPAAASPSPTLDSTYRNSSSSTPVSSDPSTPQTPAFTAYPSLKAGSNNLPSFKDRSVTSRSPSASLGSAPAAAIIPPVDTASPNHAHNPSLAQSDRSKHSQGTTSSGDLDFGMPRTMSPPSMYEETGLHARQPSIASVLSSESAAREIDRQSKDSGLDMDQVLAPGRSNSARFSYASSTARSRSPSSVLHLNASHTLSTSSNSLHDEERLEARLSIASAMSDGEVGIGLSLLASLGAVGQSVGSSFEQRALTPSPISENVTAVFPRPPSTQFPIVTSSDPVNPFGTFGESVEPVRGRLDSIDEQSGGGIQDFHPSSARPGSLATDSVESKETDSSESDETTALGHSQAYKSFQPPSSTAPSARSESVYSSSSSQPSPSPQLVPTDFALPSPTFPSPNFKFPAQRPPLDSTPTTEPALSGIPPSRSSTLSHGSGASASEWEGASDIYDNYLYRFSMASKSSRLSQTSMASKSGFNHRSIPSTSTMPPAAVGSLTGRGNSLTMSNLGPISSQISGRETSPDVDVAVGSQVDHPEDQEPLYSSLSTDSTDTSATVTPSQIPPRYDSLTMQRAPSVTASIPLRLRQSVGSAHSPHHSDEESDDESIYSRLSSKPSLSLLEAHAASLLSPENQNMVNTTSALKVVKNSPTPNTLSFDNDILTKGRSSGRRPLPLDLTKDHPRSSATGSTNDMIGPSPLLHTHWGSPVSSTGMSTSSLYEDGSSAGYPTPPLTNVRASADEEGKISESSREEQRRPLVIDDDEELPSHAINPDEAEVDMSLATMESVDIQFTDDGRHSVQSSRSSHKSKNETFGIPPLHITSDPLSPGVQLQPVSPLSAGPSESPGSATSPYSLGDLPMELLPPAAPSPLPPPSPTVGNPIPRPSLAELRGYPESAAQGQRQSLFLPHPNAPKASVESPGPMYIRQVDNSQASQLRQGPDPKKMASKVLRMILDSPPPQYPMVMLPPPSTMPIRGTTKHGVLPNPPIPLPRGPAIYARVDIDLASSNGPVPITFGLEPMGPPPLPLSRAPSALASASPPQPSPSSPHHPLPAFGHQQQQLLSPQNYVKRSVTASASLPSTISNVHAPPSATIAAPQMVYDAITPKDEARPVKLRPRSKSFSTGLTSSVGEQPLSLPSPPPLRSRGSSTSLSSMSHVQPPLSPTAPSTNSSPSRPSLSRPASNSKLRNMFSPSPLSTPFNRNTRTASLTGGNKPPSSPLAASFGPSSSTTPSQLRKVTSMASFSTTSSPPSKSSLSRAPGVEISDPQSTSSTAIRRKSTDRTSNFGKDSDSVSVISLRSQAMSPPLVGRQSSLHTKFSMPNLRRTNNSRDESLSPSITENETMQVKDMDFELVRPNFPISEGRSSEDSGFPGLGRKSESGAAEVVHLRSDSPAISISSGISGTSRVATGIPSDSAAFRSKASSKASDSEASMDAHRQREQKWMTLISTVPAAQTAKNKKVRKLLGEGVPSSVRYLVWAHLTNAKSKGVAGVYSQLSKRVRVAAFADMERDVKRCFGEHPHLQSTEGPLISLLQGYLTMVPDVQYSTGLTLIAGHTLLLAPEEDGFWIFVSMMDSALRPYFSRNSTQMEVDAALFSRALEANDADTAKKVLIDMSMNPAHICYPWFTTLFVGSLPGDYVNRVWDLFLYEGVPILIRVGLAIIYCCRRAILEATSEDAVLQYLKRPAATWLPPSPDAFVTLAFSFKLKDDDVRKQRVKMEKQVKKQAQGQGTRFIANGSGISLPRGGRN